MASAKKTVLVFGATGGQGGSVVKTLLADPQTQERWHIRGVTRDTSKPASKNLEAQGVEMVTADLDDAASLEKAMHGADAVFAVTNYWEKLSSDIEIKQGQSIANAAKAQGVQHLIWSSLMNVTKLSNGALSKVYHFDSKAQVEEYIRELGIPATFFMPGLFMSNLPGNDFRKVGDNWTLGLPVPSTAPIPLFDSKDDTGKFIKAILLNREITLGKRIYGATEYRTVQQIVEDFAEVFPEAGKTAQAVEVSAETYKAGLASVGMPEFVQEELYENMRLLNDFGYYGGDTLDASHAILTEKPTTWKEYCKKATPFAGLK